MPWAVIKAELVKKVDAYWDWAWANTENTCRQTKQWFPKTDPSRSFKIMTLPKTQWGKLCQFITGHNSLRRHLYLTGFDPEVQSATCTLCWEDEMTSAHIIGDCPALHWQRAATMGEHFLTTPFNKPIGSVLNFMRKCGLAPLQWT